MRAYLITGDVRLFESLERYFTFIAGEKLKHIPVPYPASPQDYVAAFHTMADSLEEELSKNSSTRAPLVIVDTCFFGSPQQSSWGGLFTLSDWHPLHKDPSSLFAMLVLAFPEIHWVFYTDKKPEHFVVLDAELKKNITAQLNDQERIRKWQVFSAYGDLSSLESLLECTRLDACFLFDATGLRNYLHWKISEEDKRHIVRWRGPKSQEARDQGDPERHCQSSWVAAAIDEEEPYVFLHGYLAYKLEHRVHLVTTEKMMAELFEKEGDSALAELTFQDIFLNFPDERDRKGRSDLKKRFEERYKGLKGVNKHILVTVGHKHSESYESNLEFIREQGEKIKEVFKPSGGMYNLLKDAGLRREYWKKLKEWINETEPPKGPPSEGGSHSAPGRLVVIAERLNDRAEKILEKAQTVQECILGATLALEASELLGYRTPTTALESIALRHQLEVKAECMFYGVGYNIDVKSRLKEIEMEVKAVARWFHGSVKKRSLLNAQLSIITEIARIFQDHGQFDEEQVCLRRLRDLNRQWYFLAHPWFSFFWPIRWYVEKLVGSFALFVTMLFAWPLVFGIVSWNLRASFEGSSTWQFWSHLMNAYASFFGLQPVEFPMNPAAKILTLGIIVVGFVHLGIFIAHLYTLISRR
jgi:hypothetical protein